jgi:hypothetical protein
MKTISDFFPEFENAQVVYHFFGKWPSLHDWEVIEITLNRELGFDFTGPKLWLTLYGFDSTVAPDDAIRKQCKLVLLFERVELGYLQDFNHQNAMADFMMEKYHCDRLKQDRFRIKFGEFGAKTEFTSKTIKVLSIEPFEPLDYFNKKESNKRLRRIADKSGSR